MMNFPARTLFGCLMLAALSAEAGSGAAEERDSPKDGGAPPPPAKSKDPTRCVTHQIQARFISGYDHLVHLTSECEMKVTCQVSTDVNPTPETVSLSPGEKATVLTYRGSPARVFTATVRCEAAGK